MSDETENDVAEDKSNLIGVDPLAWLSEEEKSSLLNKVKGESNDEVNAVDNKEENDVEEISAEEESTSYVIKLDSAITIRDISELMEELNKIDSSTTELVFDCSQVEKTDAAALQLITGFYLFSKDEGKSIVWEKPSDAFYDAVTLLGLNDILNLPSVAA